MNRYLLPVLTIVAICGVSTAAEAFRCGDGNRYLAYEGMHKYQILKDCGPPYVGEDVGVDSRGGKYMVLEEWLYIIEDTGHKQLYLIKFNRDGIAERIEWLGTQD